MSHYDEEREEFNERESEFKILREFVYFIAETGQLSGQDNDFIKAMYYDFKNAR